MDSEMNNLGEMFFKGFLKGSSEFRKRFLFLILTWDP